MSSKMIKERDTKMSSAVLAIQTANFKDLGIYKNIQKVPEDEY